MNTSNRFLVPASLYSNHEMTRRLKMTQRGLQLINRKVEALKQKQRSISKDVIVYHDSMLETMKEAFIKLAAARFSNGDIDPFVLENVDHAQLRCVLKDENVAGVILKRFGILKSGDDTCNLIGLSTGGHQINDAKKIFENGVHITVTVAGLRVAYVSIEISLASAIRKANALEKVLIPKIRNTLAYIQTEIEESEREEFYRLKKIKNKKVALKLKDLKSKGSDVGCVPNHYGDGNRKCLALFDGDDDDVDLLF